MQQYLSKYCYSESDTDNILAIHHTTAMTITTTYYI